MLKKNLNNKFLYIALINFVCALLLAAFTTGFVFRTISFVFFLSFFVNMNLASKQAQKQTTTNEKD